MANKRKIGIALAGGVGYCMTHIGVFQALEEAGIRPDMVAGTSGGALIGAMYASGIKLDRIEAIAKSVKWSRLMGAHFLLKGLATSEPIETLMDDLLGKGRRFADLGTELLVSAVDLVTERKVIYPEQPAQTIALPVRASCSLPLVFSPVRDGERLLVDGGMLVPLPARELRERGADFVIAADFKVARAEPRNLFDVALRTLNITNQERLAESVKAADIHIESHVGQASRWDLAAAVDLIKVGRMAAEDALAKHQDRLREVLA
ncbi:MAG TPA: patatin-like phospholipase family protein [Holophaga sp.]|nr:patatin-like phospholipase family protein [Holophaga sp.]